MNGHGSLAGASSIRAVYYAMCYENFFPIVITLAAILALAALPATPERTPLTILREPLRDMSPLLAEP